MDDGLDASAALGGYPAVAERADAEPVDDPPEFAADDSGDALAAEDGVLQTESRDAASFDE